MRILYVHLANPEIAGGQKMAVRHVEALNDLGFEAACLADPGVVPGGWCAHRAPVLPGGAIEPDDVVVVPEDGLASLRAVADSPARRVVLLCQNPYYLASLNGALEFIAGRQDRFAAVLAVGPRHAALMRRLLPGLPVEMVRCFADERLFRPGEKQLTGVYVPRKRPLEAAAIRRLHQKLHPDQKIGWVRVEKAAEAQVAEAFGRAAVFLSLSRLESVGMTTLEAMASGCLCAGFLGVGGAEYATAENGFWAPDDDCVAAADALAAAIDLRRAGGPRLQRMLEAAAETARAWSYAAFRAELEAVWMRLAPEARGG